MVFLTQLLLVLIALGYAAYHAFPLKKSLALGAGVLLVVSFMSYFSIILWTLYIAGAVVVTTPSLRQKWISKPVLEIFKKLLPPMNQTERDALEAGDVWVDGELFQGSPNWQGILDEPKPDLSAEEQAFMDNEVEELCHMLDDWETVHETKDLSDEVWSYLKEKGFLGMIIPKKFGGKEFSALAHSAVVTKIASRSVSAAVTVMVPNSLGPAELLLHYGTDEQKDYYLPRLASGEEIPCFALTGPEAGSDAGAIPDEGIVCEQEFEGKKTLGIRLTWNKRYITLAPVATVLGLAFKLRDPDNLLSDTVDRGITVALIPTSHEGVEIGNRHIPMGMAFMNGPTRGKDVFVPLDWIVGGQDYIGKGWRMLVECLSAGRAISLPSLATASAKMSYRLTGAYARVRKQFKMAIGKFEGVEESLARIAGLTYQLEASRIMTANAVDLGIKPSVVSAIAKYHMTEASRVVINDAMDVHAGRALIMGENNYIAHAYISCPIGITVEGANILTRNLMIFGQGAIRCHPYVFAEMEAAANPDPQASLTEFDYLLFKHLGYGIKNFVRTGALTLTKARFVDAPVGGETAQYYQQLTRMSAGLALVSDLSMLFLGGDLKRRERLSARLGDVLSYLYLSTTVLKYYEDSGRLVEDLPYVHWNLQRNLYLAAQGFERFFANFDVPYVAPILKRLILPLGNPYTLPSDELERELVQYMMAKSSVRERLTRGSYVGTCDQDVTGKVEIAFTKVLAIGEYEKRLRKAVRKGKIEASDSLLGLAKLGLEAEIITQAEFDQIVEAEKARSEAIQVDDYSKSYFASLSYSNKEEEQGDQDDPKAA